MKTAFPVLLVFVAGCIQGPANPVKVEPEFTPDAELVAWKDGPAEKFKGKVFRVKARPEIEGELGDTKGSCPFYFFTGNPRALIQFKASFRGNPDLPNATRDDVLVVEFKSVDGRLDDGNEIISLSR